MQGDVLGMVVVTMMMVMVIVVMEMDGDADGTCEWRPWRLWTR